MRYLIFIYFLVIFGCVDKEPVAFHLPVLSPKDLDPNWVDQSLHNVENPHTVPDFSFTNQHGNSISSESVHGKIIAVNYFFTTCPSICPTLTNNMKRVQDAFLDDNDVIILSHTVYPDHDTPEVLSAYADLYDIKSEKWHLLTGEKEKIYEMARKGHFAVTGEIGDDTDSFIHTENFVIVDKKSRIRGLYNGTNPHDVNRFIEDIKLLKKEEITF